MHISHAFRSARWAFAAVSSLCGVVPALALGQDVFREGSWRDGKLQYLSGVPVLSLRGTPQEMGQQAAALTLRPTKPLLAIPVLLQFTTGGYDQRQAVLDKAMERCLPEHRAELRAFADAAKLSDRDRRLLTSVNLLFEMYWGLGCSSLVVEGSRSQTGAPLFGRNLDIPHRRLLTHYGIVVVRRPTGKHAFASVGFPGLFGAFSGMNDRGLALALHGVFDGANVLDPNGAPSTFVLRQVLEQCSTVDQAVQVLKSHRHATRMIVMLCDRQTSAVAEVAPGSVATRRASAGICAGTNHFRVLKPWAGRVYCPRYQTLMRAASMRSLSAADVARKLHEVNQGPMTVQSMIFHPAPLRLHLAIGACPSSGQKMRLLELGPLLGSEPDATEPQP